mgnify:CR=1 FL=1
MSNEDLHTIEESFKLPSNGLIYDRPINPEIKLRSMTAQDEMLRLAPSDNKLKVMCDLIDNCIIGEKPELSAYDMCLGDYTYLLHALRIVTYGVEYPTVTTCLFCNEIFTDTIKLDSLAVRTWTDDIPNLFRVELPTSKKVIELRYQTPRMLDEIEARVKQIKRQTPNTVEEAENMIQRIIFSIKTVDGKKVNPAELENMIRKMKMADVNVLSQTIDLISDSLGPVGVTQHKCPNCHNETVGLFRYSSEFFRPSIR